MTPTRPTLINFTIAIHVIPHQGSNEVKLDGRSDTAQNFCIDEGHRRGSVAAGFAAH